MINELGDVNQDASISILDLVTMVNFILSGDAFDTHGYLFWAGNVNLDGTVKGNIIPDTNVAYDIGSDTNRFKDLYLSGNTIHLGSSTLSVDANGNFQLSGGVKSQPVLGDDSTVLVDTANSQIPYAVINFDGLPTSDPGTPGQLWRNGNDVKISV